MYRCHALLSRDVCMYAYVTIGNFWSMQLAKYVLGVLYAFTLF